MDVGRFQSPFHGGPDQELRQKTAKGRGSSPRTLNPEHMTQIWGMNPLLSRPLLLSIPNSSPIDLDTKGHLLT